MHDLLITNGHLVDGTGAPATDGDVAISDGRITEVGKVEGPACRTIDADGRLVTPGVVDIHTHYDGQAFWDGDLSPSCWHGVTTVVMGNCSVGFAPCAPECRDWLIEMMESVEDIPSSALRSGIDWSWETFPEFLDVLDRIPRAMDVGTQVPHAAVRGYVMGERGAANEPATPDDIVAMAAIVRDAIRAGALGFSTSRTILHYTGPDRTPIAGTYAGEDELFALGDALGELDAGLFEVVPSGVLGEQLDTLPGELDWMQRLAAGSNARCACWSPRTTLDPTTGAECWTPPLAAGRRCAAVRADLGSPRRRSVRSRHHLPPARPVPIVRGPGRSHPQREGGPAARSLGTRRDHGRDARP